MLFCLHLRNALLCDKKVNRKPHFSNFRINTVTAFCQVCEFLDFYGMDHHKCSKKLTFVLACVIGHNNLPGKVMMTSQSSSSGPWPYT